MVGVTPVTTSSPTPVQRGVVFAGDLLEESAPPAYGDDCFPIAWPDTVAAVLDVTTDTTIVPGHGDVMSIPQARTQGDAIATVANVIRGAARGGRAGRARPGRRDRPVALPGGASRRRDTPRVCGVERCRAGAISSARPAGTRLAQYADEQQDHQNEDDRSDADVHGHASLSGSSVGVPKMERTRNGKRMFECARVATRHDCTASLRDAHADHEDLFHGPGAAHGACGRFLRGRARSRAQVRVHRTGPSSPGATRSLHCTSTRRQSSRKDGSASRSKTSTRRWPRSKVPAGVAGLSAPREARAWSP